MAKKGLWGIIAGLVLCILVLLYLLLAGSQGGQEAQPQDGQPPEPGDKSDPNPIVASIGDRQITIGDLHEQLVRSYGTEMLNRMLDRYAIQLEAEQSGIIVTDSEIEHELIMMSIGYDSIEEYYKVMKMQLGLTKEELQEDAYYKLLLEKIATRNIIITDQDVSAYIKAHEDEFTPQSELHIQLMVLATEEQADKALEELEQGADFAVLVRDRSLDDASRLTDGDLGWILDDDPFVSYAILQAAKAMQPGQISGKIKLEDGSYAVVKMIDRRMEEQEDESVIRENVKKLLALQEAPPLKEVVQELRTSHHVQIVDPRFLP